MTKEKSEISKVNKNKKRKENDLFTAAYELFTTKGTNKTAIDEIVKKAEMPITEIFEKYGEAHFRSMETELCGELSERGGCVIATGGGVIKNEKNMELLKQNGTVLYIKASPEHIYKNIRNNPYIF